MNSAFKSLFGKPSPFLHRASSLSLRRLAVGALALLVSVLNTHAWAQTTATVTTVYNFERPNTGFDLHGAAPFFGLAPSSDGNLYGTTIEGGPNGYGTIFRLTPDGAISNLYDYGSGPLLQGTDGNLYGFNRGLSNDYGNIFRLTTSGSYSTVYNGNDLAGIYGYLIQGSDGNFYGTTPRYGTYGGGTVFRVTLAGTLTILHNFSDDEGIFPECRLVQGTDGNFYGTTTQGGVYTTLPGYGPVAASGTVFRVTPAGEFKVLHAFESVVNNGQNNDGGTPYFGLVQGNDGSFYGTTQVGGSNGTGTIYRITANGTFTKLHDFATPGGGQTSGLCKARDGRLYGFSENGGVNGAGTLFEITPDGTYTTLHDFNGDDGAYPTGTLVENNDGNFYGTTDQGGTTGGGVVYKLTVSQPAPRITSSLTAAGTVGVPFSYQIVADASPTGYSATGLPAGLVVNASTGLISGIPATAGTFTVALSASNAQGVGTANLVLTVAPVALPVVTLMATRPQVTVGSGETGRFTVALSEPLDHDVIVQFQIKGNARPGIDYVALKTALRIKAGKTAKNIRVKPLDAGTEGLRRRTVTLILQTGDGYTVGTTGKVKVKIIHP